MDNHYRVEVELVCDVAGALWEINERLGEAVRFDVPGFRHIREHMIHELGWESCGVVGVSFGGGEALATLITVAIAIHNIPEGLAISATLRPRGASLGSCAWWSVFSSLPQPLMAVPAFLFVGTFAAVLPYGLGFAAGAMTFMVFRELLPEAYDDASRPAVGLLVSLAFTAMVAFQLLI